MTTSQPAPAARAALLLLADGRFPAGGHAHSGGAEA
ncbi:MAG: urease accessory protein UreF, partial [Streptomyces sp.]|nr:urease accessory protein UreF [Streptomyces sp.]